MIWVWQCRSPTGRWQSFVRFSVRRPRYIRTPGRRCRRSMFYAGWPAWRPPCPCSYISTRPDRQRRKTGFPSLRRTRACSPSTSPLTRVSRPAFLRSRFPVEGENTSSMSRIGRSSLYTGQPFLHLPILGLKNAWLPPSGPTWPSSRPCPTRSPRGRWSKASTLRTCWGRFMVSCSDLSDRPIGRN